MPIVFDAYTMSNQGTAAGPFSFSHTVAAGEKRILFLAINIFEGDYASSVTYNGVAMTLIAKRQNAAETCFSYLYYLVAPATGSNTVTLTISSPAQVYMVASSFRGVLQASPIEGSHATGGTGTTLTFTVVTTTPNCWMVGIGRSSSGAITAGANTVVRDTVGGISSGAFDSNGARAPGSNSLVVTQPSALNWAGVAAAFKPAPPSGMLAVL